MPYVLRRMQYAPTQESAESRPAVFPSSTRTQPLGVIANHFSRPVALASFGLPVLVDQPNRSN